MDASEKYQKLLLDKLRHCFDFPHTLHLIINDECKDAMMHIHRFWELRLYPDSSDSELQLLEIIAPGVVHRRLRNPDYRRAMTFGIGSRWIGCSYLGHGIVGTDDAFEESELLQSLLETIERWQRLNPPPEYIDSFSRALIGLIIATISRVISSGIQYGAGNAFDVSRHYIIRNFYRQTLSVAEIARHAGVSCNHLTRMYRREVGTTVRELIIDQRLFAACELLAKSEETIHHVALLTGWRNHSYFSRSFRRVLGVTPSEFSHYCNSGARPVIWNKAIRHLAPEWWTKCERFLGKDFRTSSQHYGEMDSRVVKK